MRCLFVIALLEDCMGHDDPILSIHDWRRPRWASARDLGSPSRPPVPDKDGILDDWWVQLEPIPMPPEPAWFPPHGTPVQAGDTTEAESQELGVSTDGQEEVMGNVSGGDDFM